MKLIHSRPFFITLIGLPAAGKTSFAKVLQSADFFHSHQISIKIIDTDTIRSEIQGSQFQPEKELLVKQAKFDLIRTNLAKKKSIIIDDMHYYASMRHDLFEIHREFPSHWISIYINTPLSVCIQWNRQRAFPLPESVINTVANKWDEPGGKYSWDLPNFIYSPHLCSPDIFKRQFNSYLESLFAVSVEVQNTTISSESGLSSMIMRKNQLDATSRQIIATIIQNRENSIISSELAEIYHILIQLWQINITHPQFAAQVASLRIPFKQWWLSQQRDLPTLSDFLFYLHSTVLKLQYKT